MRFIAKEDERKLLHAFSALCAILLVLELGVEAAAYLVACVLLLGVALVHLKLSGVQLWALESVLERLDRPGFTPGYGALTLAAGILAILALLKSPSQILASLAILGLGDAASTIVGIRGAKRHLHNRKKTWEGTLAFFIASLPSVAFAGPSAVAVSAAAAVAESLPSRIDDNLAIAITCIVAFSLLGSIGF